MIDTAKNDSQNPCESTDKGSMHITIINDIDRRLVLLTFLFVTILLQA
jgi:hypothetical protein